MQVKAIKQTLDTVKAGAIALGISSVPLAAQAAVRRCKIDPGLKAPAFKV